MNVVHPRVIRLCHHVYTKFERGKLSRADYNAHTCTHTRGNYTFEYIFIRFIRSITHTGISYMIRDFVNSVRWHARQHNTSSILRESIVKSDYMLRVASVTRTLLSDHCRMYYKCGGVMRVILCSVPFFFVGPIYTSIREFMCNWNSIASDTLTHHIVVTIHIFVTFGLFLSILRHAAIVRAFNEKQPNKKSSKARWIYRKSTQALHMHCF